MNSQRKLSFFKLLNIFFILSISFLAHHNAKADTTMDFNITSNIPDDDFKNIATTIVNPTRFQFMAAPTPSAGKIIPLGISAGGGISYFTVPQSTIDSLNKYTDSNNNFPTSIILPRFIGKIGFPFGLDIAVNYAKVPQSSITLSGVALQFAFFNPKLLPITMSLRGGYTQITGFKPISANSTNIEGLVAIPIAFIKPYAGIGNNWSNASTDLSITNGAQTIKASKSASWSETYGIIGIQLAFLLGLDLEVQSSSDQTIYNAKLSIEI